MAKILDYELRKKILINLADKGDTAIIFSYPEQLDAVEYFYNENGYYIRKGERINIEGKRQWCIYFKGIISQLGKIIHYDDIGIVEETEEQGNQDELVKLTENEEIERKKLIDWEQRRYEIAKDVFIRYLDYEAISSDCTSEQLAEVSIEYADELIKQLKQ